MNGKRSKAIRKLAKQIARSKGLAAHHFTEMGVNFKVVEGIKHEVTAPLTVAQDTERGQYKAIKRMISQAYR